MTTRNDYREAASLALAQARLIVEALEGLQEVPSPCEPEAIHEMADMAAALETIVVRITE